MKNGIFFRYIGATHPQKNNNQITLKTFNKERNNKKWQTSL